MTFRFSDGTTGIGVLDELPKVDDSLKLKGEKWRVARVAPSPTMSGFDVWCDRPGGGRSVGDLRAELMLEVEKARRWQKLRKLKRQGLWR